MIEIGSADATTDWEEVLDLLHRAFAVMEGRIDPPSSLHEGNVAACRSYRSQRPMTSPPSTELPSRSPVSTKPN